MNQQRATTSEDAKRCEQSSPRCEIENVHQRAAIHQAEDESASGDQPTEAAGEEEDGAGAEGAQGDRRLYRRLVACVPNNSFPAHKEDRARIRVEHIIREDYVVEAFELLEMYCDLLLARFGLIQQMK